MPGEPAPRYDAYAAWYHDWVPAPDDDFVARSLLALVGPVGGQRILDLACGEGRIARALAATGNDVVGVDLSAGLLAMARGKECARITYLRGDVCATDWGTGRRSTGWWRACPSWTSTTSRARSPPPLPPSAAAGGSPGRSSIPASPGEPDMPFFLVTRWRRSDTFLGG
jgi:SAM-dependent methyltransferase